MERVTLSGDLVKMWYFLPRKIHVTSAEGVIFTHVMHARDILFRVQTCDLQAPLLSLELLPSTLAVHTTDAFQEIVARCLVTASQ